MEIARPAYLGVWPCHCPDKNLETLLKAIRGVPKTSAERAAITARNELAKNRFPKIW